MIFRVRFQVRGGHVHCRLFVADGPGRTFAQCGLFSVRDGAEFLALTYAFAAEYVRDEN